MVRIFVLNYFRTGFFFSIAYGFTFVLMMFAWTKEYKILKSFAEMNRIPFRNLLISSGVFAFSFIVRTLLDFTATVDTKKLVALQYNSCKNNTAGWALLVFFTHFLGEIFPLSLLFWLQAKMYQRHPESNDYDLTPTVITMDEGRATMLTVNS